MDVHYVRYTTVKSTQVIGANHCANTVDSSQREQTRVTFFLTGTTLFRSSFARQTAGEDTVSSWAHVYSVERRSDLPLTYGASGHTGHGRMHITTLGRGPTCVLSKGEGLREEGTRERVDTKATNDKLGGAGARSDSVNLI